jgi:hypothetical protein
MISSELTGGSFAECCQQFLGSLIKHSSGIGLNFEVITEASRNPTLAKIIREYYRETAAAIQDCLEEWKKKGSLRKELDISLFAESLVAFYDGMIVRLAIGTEGPEVRKIFTAFIESVEKGNPPTKGALNCPKNQIMSNQ